MLRRQAEGIKRAKIEGEYKGRVPKYRPDSLNKKDLYIFSEVVSRIENREPLLRIAEELGISRNTVKSIRDKML